MNAYDFFFEHSKNLEKDFILGPKESVTFKDLHQRSFKLAAYLANNFGHNNYVILIAPNSVFFITAYLAILKSGNIIVPLNPEIEPSNFEYIQKNCRAKVLITTSQLSNKFQSKHITILNETDVNAITDQENFDTSLLNNTLSSGLAEIIFTSGSTGAPKGVMISHKNLISNTGSIIEYLSISGNDTMLVVLPFYYCYGLSLLHTHLRVGGNLVLNNMFIMLGGVINDLKKYSCTGFAGVPSHFQILLRKSDSFKTTSFPDLRYVTQAGGKLHEVFIREFCNAFPDIRFNVMYGQTEATARLAWLPPDKLAEKIGSCGKAIPGVTFRIVNEDGLDAKTNEIGELIAKGDNISLGYYKDKKLTQKTFKNGWLYTGDLATMDNDGFIYLTSRKKEIIKVGGRRISPKEIEEVIVQISEVIDCHVEGVPDDILGESIKATIIIKQQSGAIINSGYIKKYCGEKLASYKIPQQIIIEEKISISSTGKRN